MTQPFDLDTRHLTPDPEGPGAQQAMVDGSQEVTTDTKQIRYDAVHRQEPLRVRRRGAVLRKYSERRLHDASRHPG